MYSILESIWVNLYQNVNQEMLSTEKGNRKTAEDVNNCTHWKEKQSYRFIKEPIIMEDTVQMREAG